MNNGSNNHYRSTGGSRSGEYNTSGGSRSTGGSRSGGYTSGGSRPTGSSRSGGYSSGGSLSTGSSRSRGYNTSGGSRPTGGSRSGGYTSGGGAPRRSYQPQDNGYEKLPLSVYLGIGVTVLAVAALIISVIVNSQKSGNRRSAYDDNIVSQSDGMSQTIVEIPDEDDFSDTDDPVSSEMKTKSFVGSWYKSDVSQSQKATLSVTMQYADSFEFRLEIWNGNQSAVISDTAFYTDETNAEFSPKKNVKIAFERGEDYVNITHNGKNSAFGIGDEYVIDGRFTEQEPEYPVESQAPAYDYYLYQSPEIVKALADTLNADDYQLYKDMMQNGLKSPIDYERTTDKNGNPVNVDAELNAVKYYAHLSSNASDMIFICSENANIYVLFYNSEEIVYYTNDKNYSTKMPASFQAVAKAKNIKPTFR